MAGETQSSDDNRLQGMYTGEEADILSSFFYTKTSEGIILRCKAMDK